MIYFLWSLAFLAFALFQVQRKGNPAWKFRKMFSNFPIKTKKKSYFKKIGQRFQYDKYSATTNFLANRNLFQQKCQQVGNFCSFTDYLNIKEIIFSIFSFLGFILLLFCDVTVKSISLFFLYLSFFFFLPEFFIQIEKEKREKKFSKEVPYFIDLFIITLRTGLNIEKTFYYVTQKKTFLTNIIRNKLYELELGRSLESLFYDLEKEIQNEEFQSFVKQLRQAKKLGVSLSHTLEIQSQCIRAKRKQRAEELCRTAAVKISIPLVLFIFPALLIIYIGPGILRLLGD